MRRQEPEGGLSRAVLRRDMLAEDQVFKSLEEENLRVRARSEGEEQSQDEDQGERNVPGELEDFKANQD